MLKNIILIGFMGAGKSSIGKNLSEFTGYKFIDTDLYIEEKEKRKITEIFSKEGEAYFRKLETDTIRNMTASIHHSVIATGGGLPLRTENAEILKKLGYVVYLKASSDVIWTRIKYDTTRPLLQGENPRGKIRDLLQNREPIYEKVANCVVVTDNKKFEDIVMEIKEKFHEATSN